MTRITVDPFEDWVTNVASWVDSTAYPALRRTWWDTHRNTLVDMAYAAFIGDGTRTVADIGSAVLDATHTMLDRDVVRHDPDLSVIITMLTVSVLAGAVQAVIPAALTEATGDCSDPQCSVHGAPVPEPTTGAGFYL